MSIQDILSLLAPHQNYLVLTLLVWLTYSYTVKCGFVSDDLAGILSFDGKLQGKEYGMISRWLRYTIVGGNFPSDKKDGAGNKIPLGKIPSRHHTLSILVFNVAILSLYAWLRQVTSDEIAFMTTALFIVHPIGTQAVAWCSALGYPLCLFWITTTLNFVFWAKGVNPEYSLFLLIGFSLMQFLGIHAMFTAMMVWVILLFYGFWQYALLGFIISSIMCLDIIKQTIGMRVSEFKKQQMGQSTVFHWRKIIVAVKTFYYYIKHVIFPNRMGLYHTYGFHYSKDMEREDASFFTGLLIIVSLIAIFFLTPYLEIRLSILWFISFLFIFLNWITIQQFITERYVFIPSVGICLLIAFLTKDHLIIYSMVFAGYLVRTWMQLPTYDNELRFYQSNHWQFPDSEVALGNLGVTYMNYGMPGASMDAWKLGASINPDYDVSWYNIFSSTRMEAMTMISHGDYDGGLAKLRSALPILERCLSAKSCHFPEQWRKEYKELEASLQRPISIVMGEHKRLNDLINNLNTMMSQAPDQKRKDEVASSIRDAQIQLKHAENYLFQREGIKTVNESQLLDKILKEPK
jgi:hypothetical protein